jgi:hypothetical protein
VSGPAATPAKAPWENWWSGSFESWFQRNGSRLEYSVEVPADALGMWKWEQECSCKPERLVLTMNSGASGLWGLPSPKHHGDWSREAAIAHMVIHIEDGTQCAGYDPQDWDESERELDMRAMARMGWTSWNALTRWDEERGEMVDIEVTTGAHVVKKTQRRRRRPAAALVTAGRGSSKH